MTASASNGVVHRAIPEPCAIGLEDIVLDAGGLERRIRLRRLSDPWNPRDMTTEAAGPIARCCDNPILVQSDDP